MEWSRETRLSPNSCFRIVSIVSEITLLNKGDPIPLREIQGHKIVEDVAFPDLLPSLETQSYLLSNHNLPYWIQERKLELSSNDGTVYRLLQKTISTSESRELECSIAIREFQWRDSAYFSIRRPGRGAAIRQRVISCFFADSLKMSGFSTDPEIPASMEEQNPVIVWNSSEEGDL